MFETAHATRHVAGTTEKKKQKIKGQNDQKTKEMDSFTILGMGILGISRGFSFTDSIYINIFYEMQFC